MDFLLSRENKISSHNDEMQFLEGSISSSDLPLSEFPRRTVRGYLITWAVFTRMTFFASPLGQACEP